MTSASSVGRMPARTASMPSTAVSAPTGSCVVTSTSVRLHVEITTASSIAGAATASRAKRSASVSPMATRSRRATGAVLWEMPRHSNSLIRRPRPRERSSRKECEAFPHSSRRSHLFTIAVALLGELEQLVEVALEVREADGHDRHVDQDQREEDQVGAGDVLAGLVERQGGHQTIGAALRPGSTSSPAS